MRDDVVDVILNVLRNVSEGLGRRLSCHIGGGGHDGMPKFADELAAKIVCGDAYGDSAIVVNEFRRQVLGFRVDEGGRTGYT